MKLLYILLFMFGLMVTGYLVVNDFNFDNISFSNYLINTLFILLLSCLSVSIIITYLFTVRKKSINKDIMTIRQYYQYKSARE
jgi:polyferredoxin